MKWLLLLAAIVLPVIHVQFGLFTSEFAWGIAGVLVAGYFFGQLLGVIVVVAALALLALQFFGGGGFEMADLRLVGELGIMAAVGVVLLLMQRKSDYYCSACNQYLGHSGRTCPRCGHNVSTRG